MMAHFYGTLTGNRGEATRCGTRESGMATSTASWSGAIRVCAWSDPTGDMVIVEMVPWRGHGESKILYRGPIGEYRPTVNDPHEY